MAHSGASFPHLPVPLLTEAVFTPNAEAAIIPVAEGCGPGRWRGPWGGCRGPGPGYWYAPPPPPVYYGGNGCPPGFWRGPWGHCRDTPYHGALPGGGWR
ncbi:GCG_CRPN prefix-to-repeats domain-containing protein [Roseomonas gilardii]|uniref:GCG_CRPN prefix-to-repeats domain-containing protein n=1 Tax=Roseomonas gilardii TaxID=257708 RepID=UPI0038D02B02